MSAESDTCAHLHSCFSPGVTTLVPGGPVSSLPALKFQVYQARP